MQHEFQVCRRSPEVRRVPVPDQLIYKRKIDRLVDLSEQVVLVDVLRLVALFHHGYQPAAGVEGEGGVLSSAY
jgi:hypothetical protein